MNKDDAELFGICNAETTDLFLMMVKSVRYDTSTSLDKTFKLIKDRSGLSNIKKITIFTIRGCSEFDLGCATTNKSWDSTTIDNQIKNIRRDIGNMLKSQHKNLKMMDIHGSTTVTYRNDSYAVYNHMKSTMMPMIKFLHETNAATEPATRAQKLMTMYNRSISQPSDSNVVPKRTDYPVGSRVTKWKRYDSYTNRMEFVRTAQIELKAVNFITKLTRAL